MKNRSSSDDGAIDSGILRQPTSDYDSDVPEDRMSPARERKEIQSPIELDAVLYKRRGGLGWNVEHNW